MKQVQAVYQAVTSVLEQHGVNFTETTVAREVLTKQMKQEITYILAAGFQAGDIEFKDTPSNQAKLADEKELHKYCNGLRDNWLNKDPRLNAGKSHEPKNPGSRAGASDPQVKALKGMLTRDGVDKVEIEAAIERRINEIQAAKPKSKPAVKVNVEDLPAEFQEKYAHLIGE